jgi:hypothetical protein
MREFSYLTKNEVFSTKCKRRWFCMKVKVMALIFMVVFIAVVTSIVANLSSSQIAEENTDFTESYDTLQTDDDEVGVELLEEIDTPGGPG